jgi:hypothetical protein
MADLVNLTDAELKAATDAGLFADPKNLDKLDADSRGRYAKLAPGPKISAALPGTAYSPDTKGALAQLNNGVLDPKTREKTREFLTTPLAHPTGTPIDDVTSPIGLIGAGTSVAAIYKAMTGPAVSAVSRAVAAARVAGHEITPTLKYEIAKSTLLAMGIPAPIAYGAATLVSGYRGNGKKVSPLEEAPPTAEGYDRYMPNTSAGQTATPPAAPTAVETPPVAAAPPAPAAAMAPAPAVAAPPAASPTGSAARPHPEGGVWSEQRIANEVAIQARRQAVQLSPAEDQAAQALVAEHGALPKDAVATVKAARDLPTKLKLSTEEAVQYQTLKQAGKSGAEAEAAILKMRSLTKKLQTPSGETVTDRVERRNTTGRWDE